MFGIMARIIAGRTYLKKLLHFVAQKTKVHNINSIKIIQALSLELATDTVATDLPNWYRAQALDFGNLCPVNLIFEVFKLLLNIKIVVDTWMYIYFLLFGWGKFNQN